MLSNCQIAIFSPLARLFITLSLSFFSLTSNLNMSSLLRVTDLFQKYLIHFEVFRDKLCLIFAGVSRHWQFLSLLLIEISVALPSFLLV